MFKFNKAVHVVKYRILWMCLSALLLLPGIGAMIYSMVTYPTHTPVKVGIDYTGGTILQYGVPESINNEDIGKTREALVRSPRGSALKRYILWHTKRRSLLSGFKQQS